MELWSCLKNGRKQWNKEVNILFNKVLSKNENCLLFLLKNWSKFLANPIYILLLFFNLWNFTKMFILLHYFYLLLGFLFSSELPRGHRFSCLFHFAYFKHICPDWWFREILLNSFFCTLLPCLVIQGSKVGEI